MSQRKGLRYLIAGTVAFLFLTALSPLAMASDSKSKLGKGGTTGSQIASPVAVTKNSAQANGISRLESEGRSLEAQARNLAKKFERKGASSPALTEALTAYLSGRNIAINTFQSATKNAGDTFKSATPSPTARTSYKAAMSAAQAALESALQAANLAFRTAMAAIASPTSPKK